MKTLVVLGTGISGLPFVHSILKQIAPKAQGGLKVIVVTPNTDQFWNLAVTRGVVPGQFSNEQLFTPLAPVFEQYPKENWELVTAKAERVNPEANEVHVLANDGGRRIISYDALVIATGSRARDDLPFKDVGTTEGTKKALKRVQEEISAAKSIVVAGGGATGSETTGELGFEFSQYGKKKVHFVIDKDLPLDDGFRQDVRKIVETELERLGVNIIANSKVTAVRETPSSPKGKKELVLTKSDGTTEVLHTDAYIPTIGVLPNASFMPSDLLDEGGYVKQNKDLTVSKYANLFAMGDVGNLETSTAQHAGAQAKHLVKTFQRIFVDGARAEDIKGQDEYVKDEKLVSALTLGRSKGTGQSGTWRLFSFLVWYLKGRYVGTNYSKDIAYGKKGL